MVFRSEDEDTPETLELKRGSESGKGQLRSDTLSLAQHTTAHLGTKVGSGLNELGGEGEEGHTVGMRIRGKLKISRSKHVI